MEKRIIRKEKPPYSERIFMGIALMIMIGLLWLRFIPEYPMEIALTISIGVILVLLKDYWYKRQGNIKLN